MTLLPRFAEQRLARLVEAFRVVIVNGPRQSGKTTLLRQYHQTKGGELRSLDTPGTLQIALSDPVAFAAAGPTPRIIDEVQRGGDPLVLSIKYLVDRDNSRGVHSLRINQVPQCAHPVGVPRRASRLRGPVAVLHR